MTNLSNHCVSLEIAKELKAAGYDQESTIFGYYENADTHELLYSPELKPMMDKWIAAPLASEIGELLPAKLGFKRLCIYHFEDDGWHISYEEMDRYWHREIDKSEADARAKMWLYLKKENLL